MPDATHARTCFMGLLEVQDELPDARVLWEAMDPTPERIRKIEAIAADLGDVLKDIKPRADGRQTMDGRRMDFVAPSAWHTGCHLLSSWLQSTSYRNPIDSSQPLYNNFFYNRIVFRGQSRPWPIRPSLWREDTDLDEIHGERLTGLRDFLRAQTTDSEALEFDLVGRVESQDDANAIAQHYGYPTNFVDFTWDPLTALFFATLNCKDGPVHRPGLPEQTRPLGVVYATSMRKIDFTGSVRVRLPPVQLPRLYRQRGFLIDYGERPASADEDLIDRLEWDQWMMVEGNCAKMLFPHDEYAEEVNAILNPLELLPESDYLRNIVKDLKNSPDELRTASKIQSFLENRSVTRPPWRIMDLDHFADICYEISEFRAIAQLIMQYMDFAARVLVNGHALLDPIIMAKLGHWDDRTIRAVSELTKLPDIGEATDAFDEMIRSSLEDYERWRKSVEQPNEA